MMKWVKRKIKQRNCDHWNHSKWLVPTVLKNGKLATLVIKECKDCKRLYSYTEAYKPIK